MARRWMVQDTDGVISGFTDDDDVDAPTGYTATTIADDATGVPAEGVTAGSTWNVLTSIYVARGGVGITTMFDITTTLGQLKTAAWAQRVRICDLAESLKTNEHLFGAPDYDLAKDFLAYTLWGSRAVFMSSNLGSGDKLLWTQASAAGPTDLDLTAPDVEIVDMFIGIIHLWNEVVRTGAHPAERILFASPVSPYGSYNLADAKGHTNGLTMLADDPITPAEIAKIATGGWVNDITV